MSLRFRSPFLTFLTACAVFLAALSYPVYAEEEEEGEEQQLLPTVASDIFFYDEVLNVTPDGVEVDDDDNPFWHVTAGEPNEDGTPTYGVALGLNFEDVTAKFDPGAVVVILNPADPVKIINSTLELTWSGIAKTELVQEADETDEEFAARQEQHEQNYIFSNFGGFAGENGLLDVVVNNSTIVFSIAADEPEGVWYIDGNNIHIAKGGATVTIEKGAVAARQIDDFVDGKSSGGNLTKTGDGTLIIGGSWHDETDGRESGLNISGALILEGGTIVLAGDRELAAGDRDAEGSATTIHQVGNVVIGEGTILDVSSGAMLELTNNLDEHKLLNAISGKLSDLKNHEKIPSPLRKILSVLSDKLPVRENVDDIVIHEEGTLRIASATDTGIYHATRNVIILVDGGMIEIYQGDLNEFTLSADVKLGEKGGTINIAEDVTFENLSVTGIGDYVKIGEGTHIVNGLSIEGSLIIAEGTTVLNSTGTIQQASRIVIEGSTAVLDLTSGTMVQLTNDTEETDIKNDIAILEGGKLRVSSAFGTGIFKGFLATAPEEEHDLMATTLFVDGGTVEIYKGDTESTDAETLMANTINAVIGSAGGTINVAENVIFQSGTITSSSNGGVVKTGTGTHIVGDVCLRKGVYDVKQGIVEFTGNVEVGTLKGSVGTTIDMTATTTQNFMFDNFEIAGLYLGGEHNLAVGVGKVTGTMTNVGNFIVYDTFDMFGGEHDARTLAVTWGTFDLKAGAMLQLTNDSSDYDIEVSGKLRFAGAEDTGFFKKDEDENYGTVNLFLDGGTIETYMPEGGADYLIAENINTILGESGGYFIVPEGMTFASGSLTGEASGGHYWKLGEGTHIINGMETNGSILVGAGTTILNGGMDETQRATSVVIENGAVLEITGGVALELTGTMTIKNGGIITNDGMITTEILNIAGGTLQLQVMPTELLDGTPLPATVNTDKLVLGNNAKISLENDLCQLGTYTFENIIDVTGSEGITNAHLAILNANQMALYRSEWGRRTTESGDSLDLTVRYLTVHEYAEEIGWKQGNTLTVAGLIDKSIGERLQEESALMRGFVAPVSGSVKEIRKALEDLSKEALKTELRAAMAGELIGDAARMVMSTPHKMVFQQLDSVPTGKPTNRGPFTLGQVKAPSSAMRLWLNPYAQSERGDGDSTTFDGYTLTRVGFMLGGDMNLTNQIIAGVVFNYGNPNIKNDLGKVRADDFMIGAYAKIPIYWQITANAMIGYGMQQYTYDGAGGKSKFDGNTIFGSLEFARSFPMMQILNFTPVVGIDFQSIGIDDLAVKLPTLDGMAINPDGLTTASLRVGLRGECMRIRTRVQYICQIAGDDYMMSAISLNNYNVSANVRSVQWGKDWVNVGVGGELVQTQKFRLFADYDLDASKNTVSHLGSLSAVVMW